MPFTEEDKHVIKVLRKEKHYGSKRFLREFPSKNWSRRGLDHLIQKIDETDTIARKSGSGRRRSVRDEDNINAVGDLVMSQEDKPQTHRSVRQISRETGIRRSSVHNIIKKDLNLKCFRKKPAQQLSLANMQARLERCRQLLRKYPPHLVDFIWFSDEKLFTVAAPSNLQNDRVYVPSSVKKRDVDAARLLRTRPTFSKSLMVSVAVSGLGTTQMHFLEPGVKINGDYYRNTVLLNMLLPDIRSVSRDHYVFQQDGAPAHRARETIALLQRETPDFIHPEMWPPNSPDINPVDYSIWGILQERVYRRQLHDVEELKERLLAEWAQLDHSIIASAIAQWRCRLNACVQANGGHFEHKF